MFAFELAVSGWAPPLCLEQKMYFVAERSFDLRTSGLWAQHASTAPLCSFTDGLGIFDLYQYILADLANDKMFVFYLSEGRFELPPTEVDCDLNAAP